ncbi:MULTISPECIES: hypothetical protein [Catenuloplanes]|uniref:Uncharacterized protein n=1 Tax=Catenuloplanes niger TaxID=587534 RepID=A0AAE3ZNU4_9ACTN|nr:hypothetical protein [Catenuloplanes niger]MDR7323373.1 hypothetical protein [Catenuloplanes niger]
MHLAQRQEHAEKCGRDVCAADCGHRRFAEWLDAPLLPSEIHAHERREERLAALWRGEIPT